MAGSTSITTSPWFLGPVLVTLVAWFVKRTFFWRPKLHFPVVGDPHARAQDANVIEGLEKYPESPFVLAGSKPPLLILPMSVFHECQNMPDEMISMNAELREQFQAKYTHLGDTARPEVADVIRQELTRNITKVFEGVQEETRYAFEKEWPQTGDWTPVPLYFRMLRVVSLLSGRVFVGLPLSRDEQWVNASINYTVDCIATREQSLRWNPVLRPFVGPFLPGVKNALKHQRLARDWMKPLVDEMLSRQDVEKTAAVESQGSFISWLLRHLPDHLKTAEHVGIDQLVVSFAAIHTTSMTTTRIIWELAKRPEYIAPLIQELQDVIREDRLTENANGQVIFDKAAIAKLRKMDSFIKEVQRMAPLSFVTPNRRVMQNLKLSNGIELPKGATIAWPAHAIHMSEKTQTYSPDYNAEAGNPPPTEFAGFRFANLRSVPGRETRHQVVTTGFDSLFFSHGKHACPGRFFAIYEVKSVLIELLLNYEIRLMGDVEQMGGEDKAPRLVAAGTQTRLDPRAMLEVRKRVKA